MSDNQCNGWVAGEFIAKSPGDPVTLARVAGWVKGLFALDFRAVIDDDDDFIGCGWMLTHIPTGYAVQKLRCSLPDAIAIAERFAACGDWNFDKVEDCKKVGPAAVAIRSSLDGSVNATACDLRGPMGSFGLQPRATPTAEGVA